MKVHKTDSLKVDIHISHPVVRVHILDKKTGEYVKKSDPDRPAVTHAESMPFFPLCFTFVTEVY